MDDPQSRGLRTPSLSSGRLLNFLAYLIPTAKYSPSPPPDTSLGSPPDNAYIPMSIMKVCDIVEDTGTY